MVKPIKKFLLCTSVLSVSLISCYSPLAVASHHHHKLNHLKMAAHSTHRVSSHGSAAGHHAVLAKASIKKSDNIEFTIGPDNTLVANNTNIPPVETPRTITTIASAKIIDNAPPVMVHSMETIHPKQPPQAAPISVASHVVAPPYTTKAIAPPVSAPMFGGIAASMHRHIVDFVKKTVATLRYSDYKLGGSKFDTSRGIYVVDCSTFVDHILKQVSPHAYTSLVNATGAPSPATQHYFEFFNELTNNSDDYWNKVNNVEQLRAGDILVFRNKHNHGSQAGGHIMVVMEKPIRDMDVYFVRVADSAPARHSEDTRQKNEGGIGIGTLLLKAAKSGRPFAYAWSAGGLWNKNVNFAMARPIEFD